MKPTKSVTLLICPVCELMCPIRWGPINILINKQIYISIQGNPIVMSFDQLTNQFRSHQAANICEVVVLENGHSWYVVNANVCDNCCSESGQCKSVW